MHDSIRLYNIAIQNSIIVIISEKGGAVAFWKFLAFQVLLVLLPTRMVTAAFPVDESIFSAPEASHPGRSTVTTNVSPTKSEVPPEHLSPVAADDTPDVSSQIMPLHFVPTIISYGVHATSIAVADLNGDAKPDMVVTDSGHRCQDAGLSHVRVFLNQGDATFGTARSYPVARGAEFVVIGDFNNDSKLDLAVLSADCRGRNNPAADVHADYPADDSPKPTRYACADRRSW